MKPEEIEKLTDSLCTLADSITPLDCGPGRDVHDRPVRSLTEAIMSLSLSAKEIADAIEQLAGAVESRLVDSHE